MRPYGATTAIGNLRTIRSERHHLHHRNGIKALRRAMRVRNKNERTRAKRRIQKESDDD